MRTARARMLDGSRLLTNRSPLVGATPMIPMPTRAIRSTLSYMLFFLVAGCGQRGPDVVPGVSLQLAQHRAKITSDLNYQLRLDVPGNKDEAIDGSVSISFVLADASAPLQLDFRESADKVVNVVTNGSVSAYRFEHEHIVIPAAELAAAENLIEIEFTAGATSLNRNLDYLYTLFVPDRARTAFPLFDQPDLKATFELTLGVPAGWTAMSNGPIETVIQHDATTEYRFARSDLISSYLFSFVAGKFETITAERNGRSMTLLHRETDEKKVAQNLEAIFDLHAAAIDWLEDYTGIPYPYQKFGFALIPAFQYGGMEHVGAIQYRADSLFLDEAPSDTELLSRASLIAHETAHMWFGDLVTMEWFDDVWTKEVFANFMAAKIVNPSFPTINHDLNFLVRHYPRAYSVDRTDGANPIRQVLPNLNEAGQMYGAIIYDKAPVMMRQLEALIGEDLFRDGMRDYLQRYAFDNATWPDLVGILDAATDEDLESWSVVWVTTAGRPEFREQSEPFAGGAAGHYLVQHDPSGQGRAWPQQFEVARYSPDGVRRKNLLSAEAAVPLDDILAHTGTTAVFNSDGLGYGLFPAGIEDLSTWGDLNDVEKGSELVNLYENLLAGSGPGAVEYFLALQTIVSGEDNQLLLNLALGQLRRIYWTLMPVSRRNEFSHGLEDLLWRSMLAREVASTKKIFFDAFADIALSPDAVQRVHEVWSGSLVIEDLHLSENDRVDLAQMLAIKMPAEVDAIVTMQLANTRNPDSKRKLEFLKPSLSADQSERDAFFESLAQKERREVESWVLDALRNLHHPLRTDVSEHYLRPSLELLQEIQITGDIFFPKHWLDLTLGNYRSATAVRSVRIFLDERPDYNEQLRMKILQSADMMFRANAILSADVTD